MSAALDTSAAAREPATRADLDGLAGRIGMLQWVAGIHLAISLATLTAVLAMAVRP